MNWVRLCREHPTWAYRRCWRCKKYVYDDEGKEQEKIDGTLERRPIPPECDKCPKKKMLHPKRSLEKTLEIGAEPTEWVRRVDDLYRVAKVLRALPAAGGFLDQERMIVRAFTELAVMDSMEDRAWRQAMMGRSAVMGGLGI